MLDFLRHRLRSLSDTVTRFRISRRLALDTERAGFLAFLDTLKRMQGGVHAPPRRGTAEAIQFWKISPILRSCATRIAQGVASNGFTFNVPARGSGSRRMVLRPDDAPSAWHSLRYEPPSIERGLKLAGMIDSGQAMRQVDCPIGRVLSRNLGSDYDGNTLMVMSWLYRIVTGEIAWMKFQDVGTDPVTGKSAPVFNPITGLPVPRAAIALPPTWILDTPRADHPYYQISRFGFQQNVPADQISLYRQIDLADPFARGVGAVATLATELEIDETAAEVLKEWMKAGGSPGTLAMARDWSPETIRQLEKRWREKRRERSAGMPMFMTGGSDVAIRELQQQNTAATTSEVRKAEFEMVLAYLGMPPEMGGLLKNSSWAAIKEARAFWGEFCILPELVAGASFLQSICDLHFGEGQYIVSFPSPIPADREHQLKVMVAFPPAFRLSEVREAAGLQPFGTPEDDLKLLPPGSQLVAELPDQSREEDDEPENADGAEN